MNNLVYIRVFENRITLDCIRTSRSVEKLAAFSTRRLAIGDFDIVLALIKAGLGEICKRPLWVFAPEIIIQQVFLGDEPLCAVEMRILYEIATLAGAKKVHIWQGNELSVEDILQRKYFD
jgi:hypothetical protein